MKPKISIIVPIYKTEKYLDKCISSILQQTFQDFELICIDDCSPDKSYEIVEKYMELDSRVSLIKHRKNTGQGGARNTGIRAAKADFIASLDSDDFISRNMMQVLWDESENGKYDVVCCGYDCVNEKGEKLSSRDFSSGVFENNDNSIDIFSFMNPAFWNKLWRKSLFIENDIYFPEKIYYQDMATIPRVLAKSKWIKLIDENLYSYLIRPDSVTTTYSTKHIIDYISVFEILLGFLEKNNLADHYSCEFTDLVDSNVYYHSQNILKMDIPKDEIDQYLRYFLMMKVGFMDYRKSIKTMSREKLMSSLSTSKSRVDLD